MPKQIPLEVAEPLIAAVKKREVLYNVSCDGYRDRSLTELAWKAVAEETGQDSTFCRMTWTSLRSSYTRIMAQRRQYQDSHKLHVQAKIPKWYLFKHLSFIDEFLANGPGVDSFSSNKDSNSLHPATSSSPEHNGTTSVPSSNNSHSNSFSLDGKKRKAEEEDKPEVSIDRLHSALMAFLEKTAEREEDPDLDYFKGILPFYKKLEEKNRRVFISRTTALCMELIDSQDPS
ncbi:uncharacterized protein LOC106013470 [Aplysia californica]|uniref:Uncharacterized protein LOC106013470 n=1 Tax=Aplysia californica TaxID=6500 RepID=A0ABM1ABY2_APLCA|nr:uncharacterized protein LOC106013470 [Aplysia californica]